MKIIGWIDLRKTPEGYRWSFDEEKGMIYCPFMPVFENEEKILDKEEIMDDD